MKTTKTAAKYSNFTPGTRVRSYDFPNRRDCYIEGRVVGIEDDRYKILVDRVVQEDVVMPESGGLGRIVQPPLNGLQGFFSAASATYSGLPVVGFAVQSYNNNVIVVGGKNVQSTYGADFQHKTNTSITLGAPVP